MDTVSSVLGYWKSMVFIRGGFEPRSESVADVCNYYLVSPKISTSGQPTRAQFAKIRTAGFDHVINLNPRGSVKAVEDEAKIVKDLGMSYLYLPVDFSKPSKEHYQHFCADMDAHRDKQVWIHCAANLQVAAFLYRYRVVDRQVCVQQAREDMEAVWNPFGVWKHFVNASGPYQEFKGA